MTMPDLNSVPASPHALASSRRHSSQQVPSSTAQQQQSPSLNILPSNQNAVNQGPSSSLPSPQLTAAQPVQAQASGAEAGVGPGPGPLRHPRPLTATELHMELEKEQEAVVNRLTRELSLLRAAQNASVVSNTSSTSAGNSTHEPITDPSLLSGSGFSIPTARRHQRSSSSTSVNQVAATIDARSHSSRPQPIPLSRQNSTASRRSQVESPAPSSALDPSSYFHNQRIPQPTALPLASTAATAGSGSMPDQLSPGLLPATMRYEETAFYRHELEMTKKENEALKKKVRDLEKQMRERRASDASRTRSESVSTTASVSINPAGGSSIAGPRDGGVPRPERERERGMTTQSVASVAGSVGVGVPEEEVRVGESAASSRLGDAE